MKFLQIDDPRAVVPIGERLLKLFGLGRDEGFKFLFWAQCLFYFLFCFVPRAMVKVDDAVMLLRLSSEFAFGSYLSAQILALFFRRRHIYKLVDMMQRCAKKTYSGEVFAFFIRSNARINKLSVNCCKYFMFAYVFYCSTPVIVSCTIYFRNQRNTSAEPEEFIMPSEMNLYYLDIRFNPLHYAIYIINICLLTVTSALSLCTKDVVDVTLIKSASLLFQVTAMQIRELRGRISQTQLNVIIESHRDTLECAKQLQEALNLSLLFQLSFCSAFWCLTLFYILIMGLDSRIFNLLVLLVIVTVETYAYCALGTKLTDQGEEVLMALQQLDWYDQSISVQKQILFMIRRSQKPIVLTAGKLFHANVLQFSEMVQKSYSFYLVLKNVF